MVYCSRSMRQLRKNTSPSVRQHQHDQQRAAEQRLAERRQAISRAAHGIASPPPPGRSTRRLRRSAPRLLPCSCRRGSCGRAGPHRLQPRVRRSGRSRLRSDRVRHGYSLSRSGLSRASEASRQPPEDTIAGNLWCLEASARCSKGHQRLGLPIFQVPRRTAKGPGRSRGLEGFRCGPVTLRGCRATASAA